MSTWAGPNPGHGSNCVCDSIFILGDLMDYIGVCYPGPACRENL